MKLKWLAAAFWVLTPVIGFAADPPVVFQFQPPNRLLNDIRTVVKATGGEQALEELNKEISEKLGEKGFEGLALDRPVVGYVLLDEKIEDSVGVVVIPVTSEKEFLALLKRCKVETLEMVEKNLYVNKVEGEAKVFLRFEAQNVYIAVGKNPKAALEPKALVPTAKLFDPADKSLASVKVYFDRLPKEIRAEIREQLQEIRTKLDELHLPDEAGEPAKKAVDELIKLGNRYADFLGDAETATARILLDCTSGEGAVEIGLTGKPGSKLAKSIAARQPSTNKFAGLITPETVAGLKLQLPLFAKEIQDVTVIGLEGGQKALAEFAPPEYKGLIAEGFKGLIRTVDDGEFDLTLALRGPDKKGFYTVVGAVAFEDPSAFEKEVLALMKTALPPMYQESIKLDVAKVGKTRIHQAQIDKYLEGDAQKMFGEGASLTFAFAPKGIFFVLGPDAISDMKSALEVKKAPSPAFEFVINPNRVNKLFTAIGQDVPMGLGNGDELLSVLAVSIEGGKELRLRLSNNFRIFEGVSKLTSPARPVPLPKKEQ
jgi:hypothetical protein